MPKTRLVEWGTRQAAAPLPGREQMTCAVERQRWLRDTWTLLLPSTELRCLQAERAEHDSGLLSWSAATSRRCYKPGWTLAARLSC